jgi:peroxiredoxin Q/BCP
MAKAKKATTSPQSVNTKVSTTKASTTVYKGVALGQTIPEFRVEATSGQVYTAARLRGKITVLYFYPKDSTPGCTLEGHDFKARIAQFKKLNAQVLGVSRDSIASHEKFKAKCGFPFELLSDANDQLAKIFDVIQMKSLYGRKFEGIERSTFVIDADGRLRQEWRKVKVNGHAAEVLECIKNL